MATLVERRLTVEPATAQALAAFGRLVRVPEGAGRSTRFYEEAVEIWSVPGLVTDADASLSIARVHPRPNRVTWMERHFKHTQIFMPLNGAPFVMVLAPPNERNAPDLGAVKAFRFDGTAGMMLDVGTWHEFPFALERPADIAVFLRHETSRDLETIDNGEAVGGDLEKRHIATRLGAVVGF